MKYFYIIKRNGDIYEMHFTPEAYEAAVKEHVQGGIIIAKPVGYTLPQSINAKDIEQVADAQGYGNYIENKRPRTYILDGVWYDGKERREIRLEPWKQKERDAQKALAAAHEPEQTPEQKKRAEAARKRVGEFVRNGFKHKKKT